jgi:ribonuclease HII
MKKNSLQPFYNPESKLFEIGVDEAGRGPMFGRVYSAAVVLPKNNDFKYELLKDSKKFTSKKKLEEVANYIKENCVSCSFAYCEHSEIDNINIRQATHKAMNDAIRKVINFTDNNIVLIDGRDFKPITYLENNIIKQVPVKCIEGGDNKYCSIAAASIIAKVERDNYIYEMCKKYPILDTYYDLSKNKGYGTAKHMDGIKKYGITEWHRKTFGICNNSNVIDITNI